MDSERKREKERRLRASATFRSINRFALPSVIHNSQPLLRFHIFETSATALCGTTGIDYKDSRCLDTDCWCFGTLGQFVQVSVLALSSREAPPPNHLNTIQPQSLAPTRKPEVHSENTWRKHTRRLLDLSQFTGGTDQFVFIDSPTASPSPTSPIPQDFQWFYCFNFVPFAYGSWFGHVQVVPATNSSTLRIVFQRRTCKFMLP